MYIYIDMNIYMGYKLCIYIVYISYMFVCMCV